MNEIKVEATLKKGISKKTGNPYMCIEILLPNGYKKVVFLKVQNSLFLNNVLTNL